ncbi:MAG TPA: hypothetical protein VFN67_09010 [Polyangiales bacterium]|nr:hypothetical protein [Polyangiales bacterium]
MSGKLMWLGLACVIAACSGVGRSVVGERAPAFDFDVCKEPLPCQPLEPNEPRALPAPALPVDLTQCTQASATLCASSATTPTIQCSALASGLSRTFQGASDLGQLGCSAVTIGHADSSELTEGRIELQTWNQVHVEIASAVPATLELVGGQIEHVSLVLHGPITLRIVDVPRVNDLRVLAPNSAVNVELLRSIGGGVAIDAPQGALLLRRSSLDHVNITAQRLDFESSSVTDAAWQAAALNAVDATLHRIRSSAERSVISACDVTGIHLASCQSLTLVQGSITDAQILACAEETGIYGTAVVHAQLEGNMILDGASLGQVVLGLGEVGSISTWDTQLTDISICKDSQELTFGGASDGRCFHCNLTDSLAQPAACRLEQAMPMLEGVASCPNLRGPMPFCGDPSPERMRPPRH